MTLGQKTRGKCHFAADSTSLDDKGNNEKMLKCLVSLGILGPSWPYIHILREMWIYGSALVFLRAFSGNFPKMLQSLSKRKISYFCWPNLGQKRCLPNSTSNSQFASFPSVSQCFALFSFCFSLFWFFSGVQKWRVCATNVCMYDSEGSFGISWLTLSYYVKHGSPRPLLSACLIN